MLRYKRFGLWIGMVTVALLTLSAIKKEERRSTTKERFYFRFKINGQPRDYEQAIGAYERGILKAPVVYSDRGVTKGTFVTRMTLPSLSDSVHTMSITCSKYGYSKEAIIVAICDKVPATTGLYKDSEYLKTGMVRAYILFQPESGHDYQSGGFFKSISSPKVFPDDPDISGSYKDNTEVNITELTASSIKGKFSGTIYRYTSSGDFPSPDSCVTITDGAFYLPLK